jgi:hypothetical protein
MRIPRDHLGKSATGTPGQSGNVPIDRLVVALGSYNFRSKIVRSSAKRPGDVWHVFGESKISDLDVAVSVEQQVLGFQVPVDDVLMM